MFKKFAEYMDARGNIAKPKEKEVADYDGPTPSAPEQAKAPKALDKESAPPKSAGKPAPYGPANKAKAPKAPESGGLGDAGDKSLIYKPDTKVPEKILKPYTAGPYTAKQEPVLNNFPADPKKKPTKTEAFLNATKDMSMNEFAAYVMEQRQLKECDMADLPGVTAYTTGKFHPHPPEAIKYIVVLADKNERIMEDLIQAIKGREGCLKKFLTGIMDQPESFDSLTDLMGDDERGPKMARGLVRSMDDKYSKFMKDQDDMYESVAPPFGMDDEEEDEDTPPMGDEEDMGDEGMGDEEDMGEEPPMGDEEDEMGPPEEDEMGDEEGPEDMGAGPEGPMGLDHGGPGAEDLEAMKPRPKKLKKKFAHDHLMSAMGEIDHMREKMKGY